MDINKARKILSALAEGVDPTTGEVLPDNCVCNKGNVVRALYTILDVVGAREDEQKQPENAGKPWTREDDEKLKARFISGVSQKEIAVEFKRTASSIKSRLAKLGLITN